jgi:dUTP pyrophosphatase
MFSTTLSIIVPNELLSVYSSVIEKHNKEVHSNPNADSGFDLFMPKDVKISPGEVEFISHDIKCKMNDGSGFYVYPRSSISKTPLMLANHVGIIDSGYRGNIIAAVRNLSMYPYQIDKHQRLFQICHASLRPFYVEVVSELDSTVRGEGGFGSTNRSTRIDSISSEFSS